MIEELRIKENVHVQFYIREECTHLTETRHARLSRHFVYWYHKEYYYRVAEESSSYNFTLCEECTYLDETWHARQSRHLVYLLPHKGYYYRLAEQSSSYNFPGVPGFLFGFCVSFLIARKIYIPNIQEDKMNRHVSQD